MPALNTTRRQFLKSGFAVAGTFALGRSFWARAYAAPAQPGPSPYGPLLPPDANGIELPEGFSARRVARAYQNVPTVNGGESSFAWHRASDGGGVIPMPDGGWVYVNNSEIPIVSDEAFDDPNSEMGQEQGGASAIRFDADGNVVDAYPILQGTNNNCAGGVTPWGTWLSCEENFFGFVYECDPTGLNSPLRLPAMGQFAHEAAAVDPVGKAIYLTEDQGDGAFYRFRPANWPDDDRPDLTAGILEVAVVGDNPPVRTPYGEALQQAFAEFGGDFDDFDPTGTAGQIDETQPGSVQWMPIANPAGAPTECRYQVPTAAIFNGGEGIWYDDGVVYFTCKGTDRVWSYDIIAERVDIVYDAEALAAAGVDAPLTGVDNMLIHPQTKDLYVAEDGGNMEVVIITDFAQDGSRSVAPFMRYSIPHSELAGPAFDPSGTRLYVASQGKRHRVNEETGDIVFGEIFEISGPFVQAPDVPQTPIDPVIPPEQPTPGTDPSPEPTPEPEDPGNGNGSGDEQPTATTPPEGVFNRRSGSMSVGFAALGAAAAAWKAAGLANARATQHEVDDEHQQPNQ